MFYFSRGARHGLKALGKLARIAQQEELLLAQPQYNGYSHTPKKRDIDIVDSLNDENEIRIKKKKNKKKCQNINDVNKNSVHEGNIVNIQKEVDSKKVNKAKECVDITEVDVVTKKLKNNKHKQSMEENNKYEFIDKSKKNKRKKNIDSDNAQGVGESERDIVFVKKKKKKCK